MSLEDKFNPNDGSIIDRVDSTFVSIGKKVGEYWQEKTGLSSDTLERSLYTASAAILLQYGFSKKELFTSMVGFYNAWDAVFNLRKTPLEEEIQNEMTYRPRKYNKYTRFVMFGISIAWVGSGIKQLINFEQNNNPLFQQSLEYLTIGVGIFLGVAADYISKSQLPPPVRKRKEVDVPNLIEQKSY